jgi:hypothetical protein
MQLQGPELAAACESKTASICRVDLSAAALLIDARLLQAPVAGGASVEEAVGGLVERRKVEEDEAEQAACEGSGDEPGPSGSDRNNKRGRKRARLAVYGNYHRYYGYRCGGALSEDPRLAVLDRGWFSGRRCLDVGCNEGIVTLAVASRFASRSMLGVDIDAALIRKACT